MVAIFDIQYNFRNLNMSIYMMHAVLVTNVPLKCYCDSDSSTMCVVDPISACGVHVTANGISGP